MVRLVLVVFLSVKREGLGGVISFTFLPSWATLFAVVQPLIQFLSVLVLPPRPLVHHLCCLWGAPIRGNSHSTFFLVAVLDSRGSQFSLGVVQPPTAGSLSRDWVSPCPVAPLCWAFCLPPREWLGPAGFCAQGLGGSCSVPGGSGVVTCRQPGHRSVARLISDFEPVHWGQPSADPGVHPLTVSGVGSHLGCQVWVPRSLI